MTRVQSLKSFLLLSFSRVNVAWHGINSSSEVECLGVVVRDLYTTYTGSWLKLSRLAILLVSLSCYIPCCDPTFVCRYRKAAVAVYSITCDSLIEYRLGTVYSN